MTVTISLDPDEQKRLADRAAAAGTGVTEYVRELVKKDIHAPLSIAQAAEPLARAFNSSGVSEEEFDAFIEQARREVWSEHYANPK
jgi:hypothetical protein